MSSKKPPFKDYKYQKQIIYNRTPEPIKKSDTNSVRFSSIKKIKETESSLMKENQDCYIYKYTLQDEADETNIVFFDANSRKFRTRSSNKTQNPKTLGKSFNIDSNSKISRNAQKYNVNKNTVSNVKMNNLNLVKNNGSNSKTASNKKALNSSYERYGKNSQERNEIIKQLKKEKDELFKSTNSTKKNQSSQSKYPINSSNMKNENNVNKEISKFSANKYNGTSNQKNITSYNNKNNNTQASKKSNNQPNNNSYIKPTSNIKNSLQKSPPNIKQNVYNQSSPKKTQNNNNPSINRNMNSSQQKKQNQNLSQYQEPNHNVETSEKKEERTLVLVPGQTIERTSKIENFENPIEEIIENDDGTFDSIIKQTKVTTITENIPIEENKIKPIEGAPELPIYKQKITHLYKTVTSMKKLDNSQGINSLLKQGNNDKYDGINKNIYKEGQFEDNNMNDINSGIKGNLGNQLSGKKDKKEKSNNEEEKHFDASVIPKGFKNEKELENFLDNLNKKGDNISPEEKAKRLNCIKELFNNIGKGKNQEENIEKLAKLLTNMSEKDRNEILQKLAKDPKNVNLLKKLLNSIGKTIRQENIEVKEINPLKFDGLFLEISNYGNIQREKNPFEGPSPYIEFYKERKMKIKEKIINFAPESAERTSFKLEDK